LPLEDFAKPYNIIPEPKVNAIGKREKTPTNFASHLIRLFQDSGLGARRCRGGHVKFSELVRLLGANGFSLVRQKGSIRYYGKAGWARLIRVDYHGPKEIPPGTFHAILKAAGIVKP
jgi:predicted RNA binding protein YcfA (HicA-like mRNA interferase family)